MAATHIRFIADVPLSKERKFGAVHKALEAAAKAWEAAVEAEGGTLEIDAVTVAKRKPVAEVPTAMPAPSIDLAAFAELGTAVTGAEKVLPAPAELETAPHPVAVRGRHAA